MKKAIVVGASSGIGRALAFELSRAGCAVGITARRVEMLEEMRKGMPGTTCARRMDVTDFEGATKTLDEMIRELGGVDLIVLAAGVDCDNPNLEPDKLRWAVDTNATGFAALANAAYKYFAERGGGCICGISSPSGLRGNGAFPAYNATKAFVSNYMEGLQLRADTAKLRIQVTDIRPGFVDTPMTKGQPGMFWLVSPETAARRILSAVRRGRRVAYTSRRWDILARIMHAMPFRALSALNKNEGKETWEKGK